jgi:hypothetical protein
MYKLYRSFIKRKTAQGHQEIIRSSVELNALLSACGARYD